MKIDKIKCFVIKKEDMNKFIRHNLPYIIWLYPEVNFSLDQSINYDPPEYSIVTENPWLISCYDRLEVAIWEDGKWMHPECQTFGASVNKIMLVVLNTINTIPNKIVRIFDEIGMMPLTTLDEVEQAKQATGRLGESVEKVLLFHTLLVKEEELK